MVPADWSETKIQDLVLFRYFSENSMTHQTRVTEVTVCMYVNSSVHPRVIMGSWSRHKKKYSSL